jgi:hypothetical protein
MGHSFIHLLTIVSSKFQSISTFGSIFIHVKIHEIIIGTLLENVYFTIQSDEHKNTSCNRGDNNHIWNSSPNRGKLGQNV